MAALNLACVVGARPNFMKMAPLLRALDAQSGVRTVLIHTGQHYDENLSDVFFRDLGMRSPNVNLNVGAGKHGEQTAKLLERCEAALERGPEPGQAFDRIIVVGDVNSTMAAALAAAKLRIPVAHVEAGLRSFDRSMPEEINRVVTDSISDLLLVSEPAGVENLCREGHPASAIHLVGNLMVDTLYELLPRARQCDVLRRLELTPGQYGVVTLHRPSNVDEVDNLRGLVEVLIDVSADLPLVFPIHPRTIQRLQEFELAAQLDRATGITQLPSLGYLDFLALTSQAKVIITDSGGLQEETTALGIPCLTLRRCTERPITVEQGTSTLIGNDPAKLKHHVRAVLNGSYKSGSCPALWDGHAADRIVKLLS